MKLSEFLAQEAHSATELAAACGVSVSTITRISKGARRPSMELAGKIARHTAWKVQPNDFLEEV